MAIDEGLTELLRADLDAVDGIAEKRMFGGLAFMCRGNMLCGVHKDGAVYRVGKDNMATALEIDDVAPMAFTGRPMGGFVDAGPEAMASDEIRGQLLTLALAFNASLPEK